LSLASEAERRIIARVFGLPIIVATAFVFVGLERLLPYNRGQKIFREGFWVDLMGYGVVQSYVLGLMISKLIEWMDNVSGLSRLHLVSSWPVWLQCGFFFVVHDLYIYTFHRLQHRNKYLWRIHEAHHSVHDVDWLAGTRSHALEIFINQTIEFAPIVLLGASPVVAVFKGVIDAVWGMYIHSNLNVRAGVLQYVINGPQMHRWHHASLERAGVNFATKLATWDWIFGTAYLPPEKAEKYGLWDDAPFPPGFVAQQLYAFRRFEEEPSRAVD
jgi:sterol desaturase/sphingolipid hydroxylase (fatty acid hydroxylase superfamily)